MPKNVVQTSAFSSRYRRRLQQIHYIYWRITARLKEKSQRILLSVNSSVVNFRCLVKSCRRRLNSYYLYKSQVWSWNVCGATQTSQLSELGFSILIWSATRRCSDPKEAPERRRKQAGKQTWTSKLHRLQSKIKNIQRSSNPPAPPRNTWSVYHNYQNHLLVTPQKKTCTIPIQPNPSPLSLDPRQHQYPKSSTPHPLTYVSPPSSKTTQKSNSHTLTQSESQPPSSSYPSQHNPIQTSHENNAALSRVL